MFCPECRAEYRPGVERCPSCDVDLVETLPDPSVGHSKPDLVEVFESTDPNDLLAVESALQGAGIEYQIDDPGAVPGESFGGSFDPAGQTAFVRVPRAQADEARALLGAERGRAAADD